MASCDECLMSFSAVCLSCYKCAGCCAFNAELCKATALSKEDHHHPDGDQSEIGYCCDCACCPRCEDNASLFVDDLGVIQCHCQPCSSDDENEDDDEDNEEDDNEDGDENKVQKNKRKR